MASASKVASGPMITWTLSRSISSCVRVFACAGCPPVSATIRTTFRPASALLRCLRKTLMPSSICRPPAASGPVRTERKPRRSGSACWARAVLEPDARAKAKHSQARRARCMCPPLRRGSGPRSEAGGYHVLLGLHPLERHRRVFIRPSRFVAGCCHPTQANPPSLRALPSWSRRAESVIMTRRGPSRLDEVAGSYSNELTEYRRSRISALEAQREGTSHGLLYDRFGWKEIPGVLAQPGWTVAVRGAVRHALRRGADHNDRARASPPASGSPA